MNKAVGFLQDQLVGLRSFGVTPGLVDTIKISAEGQPTPIKHLATSGRLNNGVSIMPFNPSHLKLIETALKNAGFNAYVFSKTTVVVSAPPVSAEDRVKTQAHIRKLGEEAKVAVRNLRKGFKQKLGPEMSQSEKKGLENKLQKMTDEAISLIDEIVQKKSKEIG